MEFKGWNDSKFFLKSMEFTRGGGHWNFFAFVSGPRTQKV